MLRIFLATVALLLAALDQSAAEVQRLRSRSHAVAELDGDKPTLHPTTRRYFTSPYHYGNYQNNIVHPLHHFYYQDRQDQDEPDETYYPTASPTYVIDISTSMPSSQPSSSTYQQDTTLPGPASTLPSPGDQSDSTWEVLNREHFIEGFGVFQEVDSEDTHHYASKLGREGVVQLQKSSSLHSHAIAVDSNKLKVAFSFYANSMTVGEGFCLEYSINDDDASSTTDWHPVRCWQSSIDFENSKWNDNFNVELNLDDDTVQVDSLRIKFVAIASRDEDVDVMFDHITLLQS